MMPDSPSEILVRLQALSGPKHEPQRTSLILAALEAESPAVRDAAIAWAARWLEPSVLATLVARDENATLRNAALAGLVRQGQYAVDHLEGMLHQTNSEVVMFATEILAQIHSPESAPALLPLVRHADPNVAQVAIDALGRLHAVEAVPVLLELLNTDLWLQLAAVQALGEIGDPKAEPALLALVPASAVAAPALEALARFGGRPTLEAGLSLLQRPERADLRDPLLRAVGAVLERHPAAASGLGRFAEAVEADRTEEGLRRYLAGVLRSEVESSEPEEVPGRDDRSRKRGGSSLVRAAGTLSLAAGLRSLFPEVLVWAGESAGAAWIEPLCRRHPQALDAALPALLKDADSRVRCGTLLAGAFRRDQLPFLRSALLDPVPEVRAAACWALGNVADPASIEPLLERLQLGTSPERAGAVAALGRMPGDALQALEPHLGSAAPEQVVAALEVVERAKSRLFDIRVLELVKDARPNIRRAALRVVATMDGARTEGVLLRALADSDEGVQIEALNLLVRRGGDRVVKTLLALLGTDNSLRTNIIRALGRLRAAEATPMLESMFTSSPLHERIEIISALVRIAPPGIMRFLQDRLQDRDAEIRRVAAHGVADLAGPDDLQLLLDLTRSPDWPLRHEAVRGLAKLKRPACRPALLDLVRDLEPVVGQAARRALEEAQGGPASAP